MQLPTSKKKNISIYGKNLQGFFHQTNQTKLPVTVYLFRFVFSQMELLDQHSAQKCLPTSATQLTPFSTHRCRSGQPRSLRSE